jgi:hypothetical protein
MCPLPAPTVAGRGLVSPSICPCWLPVWLPRISLASLMFEGSNAAQDLGRTWRKDCHGGVRLDAGHHDPHPPIVCPQRAEPRKMASASRRSVQRRHSRPRPGEPHGHDEPVLCHLKRRRRVPEGARYRE